MILFHVNDDRDDEVTYNLPEPVQTPQSVITNAPTPQSVPTNAETPLSVYQPSECFTTPFRDDLVDVTSTLKEKFNSSLASRGVSLIRYTMVTPQEEAAERTKRFHIRKARKVVIAASEEIVPYSAEVLLE